MANDKACKLLGCSSQNLIGQKLSRLISKSSQEVWEAVDEESIETDECSSVVSGTVVCEMFKQTFPTICSGFVALVWGFFFSHFQYNFLIYLIFKFVGIWQLCHL